MSKRVTGARLSYLSWTMCGGNCLTCKAPRSTAATPVRGNIGSDIQSRTHTTLLTACIKYEFTICSEINSSISSLLCIYKTQSLFIYLVFRRCCKDLKLTFISPRIRRKGNKFEINYLSKVIRYLIAINIFFIYYLNLLLTSNVIFLYYKMPIV